MSRDLQIRSPLQNSIQQHNNRAAGSLIAKQIQSFTYEGTARSLDPEKDTAIVDTTGGTVTMLLPVGSDANKGLPFFFYKLVAGNTLTVARATGSGQTIEGATSVSATGIGACIAMFWDGSTWRRLNASVAAATGLLAANNLSDVASAATARTNLGVSATTAVDLKADVHLVAAIECDLIDTADGTTYSFIPLFAGTLTNVAMVLDGATTAVDAASVAIDIDGTPVVLAAPLSAPAVSAAGFEVITTVSSAGAFTAGQRIKLTTTSGNTSATRGTVSLGATRA